LDNGTDGLGVTDAVYMAVTKVSGDWVEGTVFWKVAAGTPSENQELLFVGTLVGKTHDPKKRATDRGVVIHNRNRRAVVRDVVHVSSPSSPR
jgi:hypothetical protein